MNPFDPDAWTVEDFAEMAATARHMQPRELRRVPLLVTSNDIAAIVAEELEIRELQVRFIRGSIVEPSGIPG